MRRLVFSFLILSLHCGVVSAQNTSPAADSIAPATTASVAPTAAAVNAPVTAQPPPTIGFTAKDSVSQPGILNNELAVNQPELDTFMKYPGKLIYHTPQNISLYPKSWLNRLRFSACLVILLGFFALGFYYAIYQGLVRDDTYAPDGTLCPETSRPFSFSRVQLFWWTMIILFTYTYSFGVTGVLIPINATMVLLLGSGVLVYAGGRIIDKRQIANTPNHQRHQDKYAPGTFFEDILSDENGISMHRFQAMVFNVIFGVSFVCFFFSKFHEGKYPFITFSEWQFALIGISSVTYLGLKANENNPTAPGAQAAPPPQAGPVPPPPAPPPVLPAQADPQPQANMEEAAQRDPNLF
jgi:hypothetical protein